MANKEQTSSEKERVFDYSIGMHGDVTREVGRDLENVGFKKRWFRSVYVGKKEPYIGVEIRVEVFADDVLSFCSNLETYASCTAPNSVIEKLRPVFGKYI